MNNNSTSIRTREQIGNDDASRSHVVPRGGGVLWVEQLSGMVVLLIAVDRRLRYAHRIMYCHTGVFASGMLHALRRLGWSMPPAEQFKISMGDKRWLGGKSLYLEFQDRLVDIHRQVLDRMWRRRDLAAHWYREESVARVRAYLESRAVREIESPIEIGMYALWQGRQSLDTDKLTRDIILILPRTGWNRLLKPHLDRLGVTVRLIGPKKGRTAETWFAIGRRGAAMLKLLLSGCCSPRHRKMTEAETVHKRQSRGRNKICVPYTRSIYEEERNDLFWFGRSDIQAQDVVVLFDSSAYPVSNEELKHLRERGFNYVIYTKAAAPSQLETVWRHTDRLRHLHVRSARHALRQLPYVVQGWACRWQWWQLVELMKKVDSYQDFLEDVGIKVEVRVTVPALVPAIAHDNIGGAVVVAQWSAWDEPHPTIAVGGQVYACMGPEYATPLSLAYIYSETVLYTGYLFDGYFVSAGHRARQLREKLTAAGARIVVSLFDERVSEKLYPRRMLAQYYSCFLEECLRNPEFGLIIKPKSNDVFRELASLAPLLEKSKATGRCQVLEDEMVERRALRKNNPVAPAVAALASDIAVSLISTTAIEAALVGVPSLLYDTIEGVRDTARDGSSDSHFTSNDRIPLLRVVAKLKERANGDDCIVFEELDQLIAQILRWRETGTMFRHMGTESDVVDGLDPFRDGQAGLRIGSYLRWIREKYEAGWEREAVLSYANGCYMAKWGVDKVMERRPKAERISAGVLDGTQARVA